MTGNPEPTPDDPTVRVATRVGSTGAEQLLRTARDAATSVRVVRTGPTGIDAFDPLVLATVDGETALYAAPGESTLRSVVSTLDSGDLPTDEATAVVTHDPATSTLPVPATGPLSVGRRAVLGPCGWRDPLDADAWSPVADTDPDLRAASALLGRGRGDAALDTPVGEQWEEARSADGDPVVVVNAHDASGLPTGDDLLLAAAPLAVLDGAATVAAHVGADEVVVLVSEGAADLHDHLRDAAAAASLPAEVQVVAGPDQYRAGEPTAALEALEGADRIEPRLTPPGPATHGLYGRPTVVHTPRTLAQVRRAARDPDAVDPEAADPGTRLVAVAGDVRSPATVELPSSASLARVRDAVEMTGTYKMACVGGVLGGLIVDLDLPPTAGSFRAAGLGTDGTVELLDESRCAVATAGERARFAATENSGRCVPGREGTKQLTELLREVYDGAFESDKIRELARVMRQSSNCRLGASAPRPAVTALDRFDAEFRAHADGRCPSGTCRSKL
ncbi:NADH-ubiquinone oxidoreductase-F iron-sulfur binding region domain-containing protein [Salinigranum sp.]|uniref:NADH-ubiquinone oxidoreductase-F iron-sulfur binding region domain-containing protein n=1 Tax=Salinigranum sp. TaxID=1966351 RepID=UPI003566176F